MIENEVKDFLCPICRNVEIEAPSKNTDNEENHQIIIIIDEHGSIDYHHVYNGNRKMLFICMMTLIWFLMIIPIIYLYYEENKM